MTYYLQLRLLITTYLFAAKSQRGEFQQQQLGEHGCKKQEAC